MSRKKKKRQKNRNQVIAKIAWIFFEALAVFFVNYFLFKALT